MAKVNPSGTLQGKTAIVTGASRGIGEAIAVRLAMEGARVIASARTAADGESNLPGTLAATVDRIRRAGGEAVSVRADLSSADDRERLFLPYFSTKNRGTGLGLAIVHHILSDHGAQIRVVENQPAGARFIVEIPIPAPADGDQACANLLPHKA